MRTRPKRHIVRAYVIAPGDPSVGIDPSTYDVEVYIDPSQFESDENFWDEIDQLRKEFIRIYSDMLGDKCFCEFDFEIEGPEF